jgi:hypothetical protein
MAKEKKSGGVLSFFFIVIFMAAAILFAIMYFAQKVSFDESRRMLSEAKGGYGSLLSDISDLRLRLNAAEDKSKKLEEAAAAAVADAQNKGVIKGLLSHEKSPMPLGLLACAESKAGDKLFCINHQDNGNYELNVPAGEYYIFAMETCYPPINNGRLSACPSNVAYYTEFVKCDPAEADNQCPHEKALVTVSGGATLDNINPSDWFKENKTQ